MGELSKLKGLGPKSEQCLNEVGIYTKEELQKLGAIQAFILLGKKSGTKPSLNFLYAMAGALEDRHWADIAKAEKARLLFELEGYRELEEILMTMEVMAIPGQSLQSRHFVRSVVPVENGQYPKFGITARMKRSDLL